jgi:hypothetical protein
MKVGTQEYDSILNNIMVQLSHHAKEEEEDILPWIRASIGPSAMIDLGKTFMSAFWN